MQESKYKSAHWPYRNKDFVKTVPELQLLKDFIGWFETSAAGLERFKPL